MSLILAWALAVGQIGIMPGPVEPRVRLMTYDADQVVTLPVENGYAAVVEFSPDESIDSVIVGNSAAWQVTTARRGDRLVVKPVGTVATDMVVVTDARRYVFLLQPASGSGGAFVLRFVYPGTAMTGVTSIVAAGATYRFRGAKALFPETMRDDGARTTIGWDQDTPLPAIFAIDRQGHEALVNGRVIGGSYVIEGVAPRYILRAGKEQAVATRSVKRLKK